MHKGLVISRLLSDFVCTVAVLAFSLCYYQWVGPTERGFGCNDSSLTYPIRKTFITSVEVLLYFVVAPIVLFVIVEAAVFPWRDPNVKKITYLVEVYKIIVTFIFGIFVIYSIVVFVKLTVGRLRPHFIAACQPDVNCKLAGNVFKYVSDYACMGEQVGVIREARLSFPSGHSSTGVQSATFVAMYIDAKISWEGVNLVKKAVSFFIFTGGVATAVSRVSDYKHHWTDVLAGTILGFLGALWMFFWMTNLSKSKKITITESRENE